MQQTMKEFLKTIKRSRRFKKQKYFSTKPLKADLRLTFREPLYFHTYYHFEPPYNETPSQSVVLIAGSWVFLYDL